MKRNRSPLLSIDARDTLFSYGIGFGLSLLLTLSAFFVAPLFGGFAVISIVLLAVIQLCVQLYFFLHLGRKREDDSNLVIASLTVVIIGILVIGTLWIMNNLAPLHAHELSPSDLYEQGVVSPEHELR